MSLYETLGVKKTASVDAIKNQFRRLAKKHHPDKGGNVDQFTKVQQAYEILSNPELRNQYDVTGEIPIKEVDNTNPRIYQLFFEIFMSIIQSAVQQNVDPETLDIIKITKEEVLKRINQNYKLAIKNAETTINIMNRMKKRFEHKKGEKPFIVNIIEGNIRGNERLIEENKNQIKVAESLMYMLNDISFNQKMQEHIIRYSYTTTGSSTTGGW